MYLERIQPTFAMGSTISTEKARTAALFGKPTKILEDAIVGGRTPLLNVWSAPLNGGEPIKVDGQIVGAVGVSGASSAARDAAIAIAGAGALGGQTRATAAATTNRCIDIIHLCERVRAPWPDGQASRRV